MTRMLSVTVAALAIALAVSLSWALSLRAEVERLEAAASQVPTAPAAADSRPRRERARARLEQARPRPVLPEGDATQSDPAESVDPAVVDALVDQRMAERRQQRMAEREAAVLGEAERWVEETKLDAETADALFDLIEARTEGMRALMDRVQAGELDWDTARPIMREQREADREATVSLLGEERAEAFFAAVFERGGPGGPGRDRGPR